MRQILEKNDCNFCISVEGASNAEAFCQSYSSVPTGVKIQNYIVEMCMLFFA